MSLAQTLARLIMPRQKANPAGEGNYHPGPYTVSGGWLPHSWGQNLNFWQMDLDPLPFPTSSIVEACVWAYVRAIAQLPGYHRRELDNGGTETITTSALSRLLRVPNGYQTPSDFLVHLIRSLLLNGNSYWVAQRNERSEVVALHWTDPRGCCVREIGVQGQVFKEVFYEISSNPLVTFPNSIGANNIVVPARDVFHVKLATPRHPLVGETWLAALALELFQRGAIHNASSTFAQNMSRPSGVLTTDMNLTAAQVAELKERWNAASAGLNSGGVPILTNGLKFHAMSVSNQDAQIIEQLKLTDRTVAAVMGVPAILLGISDTATQKSAEAVMSEWLSSGLGWLINHIEVGFDAFIGLNAVAAGREWTEFETKALLRSLFKEQIDGLARSVQAGIHAPDEARYALGFAAVPGGFGKMPRVQQQMVPLDFEPPEPKPAPAIAAPAPAPTAPQLDDDERAAIAVFHLQREINHVWAAAFDPNQPRDPGGEGGGQWISGGGEDDGTADPHNPVDPGKESNLLTSEEQASITYYQGMVGFSKINDSLRAGNSPGEHAKRLSNAIAKYRLVDETTVHRGIGNTLSKKLGEMWRDKEPGDAPITFVDKGFVSTSMSKKIAETYSKNTVTIKLPKGHNALPVVDRDFAYESEILLNRGTKFKVTNMRETPTGWRRFDVEIVT